MESQLDRDVLSQINEPDLVGELIRRVASDLANHNERVFPNKDAHVKAARKVIEAIEGVLNAHPYAFEARRNSRADPNKPSTDIRAKGGNGTEDVVIARVLIERPQQSTCEVLCGISKDLHGELVEWGEPITGFEYDAVAQVFPGAAEAVLQRVEKIAREWMEARTR